MPPRSSCNIHLKLMAVFLLYWLLACGQSQDRADLAKPLPISLDSSKLKNNQVDTLHDANKEYLDFKVLKINKQLPLLCTKNALIELLGPPDSTVVPNMDDVCISYFDGPTKVVLIQLADSKKGSDFSWILFFKNGS